MKISLDNVNKLLGLELKEKSVKELEEWGIHQDGEYLHVPITLPCTSVGPINMVPVDWLCDMLLGLLKVPARGQTFHLTHPNPPSVRETVEFSTRYLGLQDISCGTPHQNGKGSKLPRLKRSITTSIEPFRPYTSKDEERFGNEATVAALGSAWREPPPIDSALIGRLLEFAKSKKFNGGFAA